MANYYGLRGWLECDPDHLHPIEARLRDLAMACAEDSETALYMGGWCMGKSVINWTGYVFYGADVRKSGVSLLVTVLRSLAELKLDLTGFFHAQSQQGEPSVVVRIRSDEVSVEENAPPLV